MTGTKFNIAIVGGGIGGLTLALSLTKAMKKSKQNIKVDVYEAARQFTEIGAGIGTFPRPLQILERLGLREELTAIAFTASTKGGGPFMTFRKSDQQDGIAFPEIDDRMNNFVYHRAEFLDVLDKHLDPAVTTAHFSKRLVSYEKPALGDSSPIVLHFKDGSTATCDVLIGADGIHSATRVQMYKDLAEENQDNAAMLLEMRDPEWSGSVAYRSVLPREALEAVAPNHQSLNRSVNYLGKDKHVITLPISDGRLLTVAAFYSEPSKAGTVFPGRTEEPCDENEMLEKFEGWEPELLKILKCVRKPSRWVINHVRDLPTWSHDRVAIIGDAAHAMSPHQGSGAGQAIDDAYILSALLCHPLTTIDKVPMALKVYDAIRRPLGSDVKKRSTLNGQLFEFDDPNFLDLATPSPSRQRMQELINCLMDNWKWAWTTDAKDDRDRAVSLLEKQFAQNG